MVHIYNGILLSLKKKANLVICSEVDGPRDCHTEWVSQKEKNKYRILMHICGIWNIGIDDLIYKAEIETET